MTTTIEDKPLSSPKTFRSNSNQTVNDNIVSFLTLNIPEVKGSEFYKIIHLWSNKFRVNYYKYAQTENSVMRHPIMVESFFIEVPEVKGVMSIRNRTMEERFNYVHTQKKT